LFTGSTAVGRKVMAAAAPNLTPVTLELGGKAPAVVCEDADLSRTAQALVWGAFANSGQICASVERVYAHEAIHDELVDRVVTLTRSLRQGDASVGEVDVGAMAWDRQVDIVEKLVDSAVKAGAVVEVGGKRGSGPGLFFEPTVLTSVRQDMDVVKKEIFGPVMPIVKVNSEDEAIRLANDSHLGLNAYVFSQDAARARSLAERIEAGTVMINDVLNTYGCPETPWGGVKASGIGRTHSAIGLKELCQLRHVNYDRVHLPRELWWYPYKEQTYKLLLKGMRLVLGKRPWSRGA
jgi:succinate-semialdehyde dehydrogenase/glutarate-semialdehyde dehydrogenase